MDDEDVLQLGLADSKASPELQQLCSMQMQMLLSALEVGIGSALAVSGTGWEDAGQGAPALQCTAFLRDPSSLQTGELQLSLAASVGAVEGDAARQRHSLLLGHGQASLAEQEQWLVEQAVIVLPDSGGLVLPLANGGFLVGLFIVERLAASSGGGGNSGAGTLPPPSAGSMFGPQDVQLIKQSAAVLALACAMDLRSVLERSGNAVRQRQLRGLVRQAKQPLSTLRTLGAMLAPRLLHGEPDRDMAEGILAQGDRLQELVSQLQSALHPAALPQVPPPGAAGTLGAGPRQQGGAALWAPRQQGGAAPLSYPALPSSSIGSDYSSSQGSDYWGPPPVAHPGEAQATVDLEEAEALLMLGTDTDADLQPAYDAAAAGGNAKAEPVPGWKRGPGSCGGNGSSSSGSAGSTDVLSLLMPLLASAANLASVNGVYFFLTGGPGVQPASVGSSSTHSIAPTCPAAVEPAAAKRMLCHLVDSVLSVASRGDLVEASVQAQQWNGRPGIAVRMQCERGLQPAGGGVQPPAWRHLLPAPELSFLQAAAQQAGGWFDVQEDRRPAVRHGAGGRQHAPHLVANVLLTTLWLPCAEQ